MVFCCRCVRCRCWIELDDCVEVDDGYEYVCKVCRKKGVFKGLDILFGEER